MQADLSFGQWLKRRRRGLGLTQVELGRLTGYSGESIRKVEADEARPSPQMAAKLADALEIPSSERVNFIRFARDEDADISAVPTQTVTLTPQPTPSRPTNLPVPTTPLVGRAREIAAVEDLIHSPDVRLVTLTGAGGVGKTRLGLQIGVNFLAHFAHGVYLVNLAPISDAAFVASAIAQPLGVRESGGRAVVDLLKDYLADKNMLLLIDNFEQVLSAAPIVGELLAVAPDLKVIVTSRERLRLRGEKEFIVPPLALPDARSLPSWEQIPQFGAVELFVKRAQDVRRDFDVTHANAAVVAQICHRLDGLPLAIELAASRLKLFTPEVLLTRLENRLKLLTGGARDLPTRQQTLRNTLAWSYDLLEDEEKALFRRLAVFNGGWTLEAAEAVCSTPGDGEVDILDGLQSLIEKSLLQPVQPGPEARFTMLETIREYALERLTEQGEADTLRNRHAQEFLALAEDAEPRLTGPDQGVWLARLEREHDNLGAAMKWAEESCQAKEGLRFVGALWRFWEIHGHLSEGRARLTNALSVAGADEPSVEKAKALNAAGNLAKTQGDYVSARQFHQDGLATNRLLGDRRGMARSLNNLGLVLFNQQDYASAQALLEESLALKRELNDEWGIATSLNNLGEVARARGEYGQAEKFYSESLALLDKLGDIRTIAWSLHNLAHVARYQRDYAKAATLFKKGLAQFVELDDKWGIAACLTGIAEVLEAYGQLERAVHLIGAAESLIDATGALMWSADRAEYDEAVARLRSRLSSPAFETARTEGRAMTLEDVIAYASDLNPSIN
ncbi:MAG: tetratricopeptide repeat protein [Anaerolineae bacterium]